MCTLCPSMPFEHAAKWPKCEQVQCFNVNMRTGGISCHIIVHSQKHELIQIAPPADIFSTDIRLCVLNSLVSALASSNFTTQKSPISKRSFGRIYLYQKSNEFKWNTMDCTNLYLQMSPILQWWLLSGTQPEENTGFPTGMRHELFDAGESFDSSWPNSPLLHKSCTFCSEKLAEDKYSHEAHGIMPFKTGNCVLPSLLRLQVKNSLRISLTPLTTYAVLIALKANGKTPITNCSMVFGIAAGSA